MVKFQPEELYSVGQQGADFHKGLATAVSNTVCGLYQSAPKGFVTGTLLDAPGALARGYWDSFCGRIPEPKLPAPPSTPSGKCSGKTYKVDVSFLRQTSPGVQTPVSYTGYMCGPISYSVRAMQSNPDLNEAVWTIGGYSSAGATSCTVSSPLITFDTDNLHVPGSYQVAMNRVDGGADNCGDLAFGGSPPAPSNPAVYNYQPPSGGPPVQVPYSVDFDPTLIVPIIRIPINANANVDVTFDAGGINVDMPINLGFGGDEKGISPDDLAGINDKLSGLPSLKDLLEDLTDTGPQSSNDKGEKEGGDEAAEPGITGLIIQVTSYPTGYGRKFGQPQVFDFGRAHFKRGDFYSTSVPITLVRQWVRAEPDSDGYVVRLNPGVKANITVVKQETE